MAEQELVIEEAQREDAAPLSQRTSRVKKFQTDWGSGSRNSGNLKITIIYDTIYTALKFSRNLEINI